MANSGQFRGDVTGADELPVGCSGAGGGLQEEDEAHAANYTKGADEIQVEVRKKYKWEITIARSVV